MIFVVHVASTESLGLLDPSWPYGAMPLFLEVVVLQTKHGTEDG